MRSRGRPVKPVFPAFLVFAVLGPGLMEWEGAGRTAQELCVPYQQEEVSILNGGITLAGTLTRPKIGEPFGAVILLQGSGPLNRDEEAFGWKPFRVLADHLTRSGLAALRLLEAPRQEPCPACQHLPDVRQTGAAAGPGARKSVFLVRCAFPF